jgi:hypothetical protein
VVELEETQALSNQLTSIFKSAKKKGIKQFRLVCFQLFCSVKKEQYILKQDLAKEEIQRRYDGLRLPTISLWVVAGAAQQPGPGFCLNVTFSP